MDDSTALRLRQRALISARSFGFFDEAEDLAQDAIVRFLEQGFGQTVDQCVAECLRARYGRYGQKNPPLVQWETLHLSEPTREDQLWELVDTRVKLKTLERVVFILYGAFGFKLQEVGRILGVTESRCSQIFTRAKSKLQHRKPPIQRKKTVNEPKRVRSSYCLWCTGLIPWKQKYCSEVCRENWEQNEVAETVTASDALGA